MSSKGAAALGLGYETLSCEEVDDLRPDLQLTERLRAAFASPDFKPPALPAIAVQVHALSRKPNVDMRDLVALIEKDALMAANLLRTARSAAYATRLPPTCLHEAATRLGLNAVRDIVWDMAINGTVFRGKAYRKPMANLRRHSSATAHIARVVASYTAIGSDYAFLCGLLHDVGLAASMIVLGDPKVGKPAPIEEVAQVMIDLHEEAGAIVAKSWKLPLDVELVISHHHDPRVDGLVHPLSAVVCVAEHLATNVGAGFNLFDGSDVSSIAALDVAREALDLSPEKMKLIVDEVDSLMQRVR